MRRSTLVILTLFASTSHAVAAPSLPVSEGPDLQLEQALFRTVKPMLNELRNRGAKVVGVLKFSISNTESSYRGNLGTLNMRLAEKTELALVWANPASEKFLQRQVGVIKDATQIASRIPGADHLANDLQTRDRVFEREYPLAWKIHGSDTARPDAFIFGDATVHRDLSQITIELKAIRKGDPDLITGEAFTAPLDLDDKTGIGESYVVRNQKTNPVVWQGDATHAHPLKNPDSPVEFEVYYDGVRQAFRFLNQRCEHRVDASIAEPRQGQKVAFVVKRRDPSDSERYGIVLQVNGENTLYRQRLPIERCGLWVMEKERKQIAIGAFQINGQEQAPFVIRDGKQAQEMADRYGQDIGLISLTVYSESAEGLNRDKNRSIVGNTLQELVLPLETAENRSQLGGRLASDLLNQKPRGIIMADDEIRRAPLSIVQFRRSNKPIFSASVRYYR